MAKRENKVNAKFIEELNLVWNKDADFIDYCIKEAFEVVELDNDFIFVVTKPRIETRFCYGYGQFGMTTVDEEEGAREKAKAISQFEVFKQENVECNFSNLSKLIETANYYELCYSKGKRLVRLMDENSWRFNIDKPVGEVTNNDRIKLKEAYERAVKRFEKRLETYWKRYGASKLNVWTYLID